MDRTHSVIVGRFFTINEQRVKDQIEGMVFGFMDDHDLDELILDNASCQDGLRERIAENGYQSPGFATGVLVEITFMFMGIHRTVRIACCLMLQFLVDSTFCSQMRVQKTIPDGIRVAQKIQKDIG
jgi:hypothetical protein